MSDFGRIQGRENAFQAQHGGAFQMLKGRLEAPNETRGPDLTDLEVDIDIHEHLCPNGDTGFTVYDYRTVDGVDEIKATGEGCGSDTFDWTPVNAD